MIIINFLMQLVFNLDYFNNKENEFNKVFKLDKWIFTKAAFIYRLSIKKATLFRESGYNKAFYGYKFNFSKLWASLIPAPSAQI